MAGIHICICIISGILLFDYGVNTQNYYHTHDTDKNGGYEFSINKGIPDHLLGVTGNRPQVNLPQSNVNGNNGNIQRLIPNSLYKYPVSYKPLNQEVPVKNMNILPTLDDIDANNDLTPKVNSYLVANKSYNGYDKDWKKVLSKEHNNRNIFNRGKKEKNNKDAKTEEETENTNNHTFIEKIENKTADEKVNNRNQYVKNGITKDADKSNTRQNKSEKIQLVEEPLLINNNMGDNLQGTEQNEKEQPFPKHPEKVNDNVKKVELSLPVIDTTTIIVHSRTENEPSDDEPQMQQNYLEHEQNTAANDIKYDKRNLKPNAKAIEFNVDKPHEALSQKISPLAYYAINSRKWNSPLYSYIYPFNMLYPKLYKQ